MKIKYRIKSSGDKDKDPFSWNQRISITALKVMQGQKRPLLCQNHSNSSTFVYGPILMKICSDGDPLISRKRILIHISGGLDSILIFIKHFLYVLKISKRLKLLFSSSERQVNIQRNIDKDPGFQLSIPIVFTWRS